VCVLALWEVEFHQHAPHVPLHGSFGEHEAACDVAVGQTLGHQGEHLAFTIGERGERVSLAADERCDDVRVEGRAAASHALGCLEEIVDVEHPRDTARAMSQENVEIARKAIDAFNRGGVDAWLRFLSPDVVWESLPLVGFRDVYRGRAEARKWLEQLTEVFEEVHLEIEQITPLNDDRVLTESTQIARGTGSGLPVEQRAWEIVWLADGLITRRQPFSTRDQALEAAGLRE
jgi:ketosteroid isomerase-like protein